MTSEEPMSAPDEQPIPAQISLLLQDNTLLRMLIVLNVCVEADRTFLTRMANEGKNPQVSAAEVGECLSRLEQHGYLIVRRFARQAFFWRRQLEIPFYSITPVGKSSLAQALAFLEKGSRQPRS
jgi:hypothetical protein